MARQLHTGAYLVCKRPPAWLLEAARAEMHFAARVDSGGTSTEFDGPSPT